MNVKWKKYIFLIIFFNKDGKRNLLIVCVVVCKDINRFTKESIKKVVLISVTLPMSNALHT